MRLLGGLDYLDDDAAAAPHRCALLRMASQFVRVFTLRAESAPGLVAMGAEVNPACLGITDAPTAGVSGTGLTLRQAFEACVGEGVEYLSQFVWPRDAFDRAVDAPVLAEAPDDVVRLWHRLRPHRRPAANEAAAWTQAADMSDGRPVLLPADVCYRRAPESRDFDVPWPLGTGCGAGPDLESATLHGLLEVIERDAVALWWRGGMRGRLAECGTGAAMLARLRGGKASRRTWLLDITSDISVPVAVAASCNDDGYGLCVGFACRPAIASAADAALRELAQMELAHQIARAKQAGRGEAALNDTDRLHLNRYMAISAADSPALQPMPPPPPPCDLPETDILGQIRAVRERLAAAGVNAYAVNLSRPDIGVPATRVVCPDLETGLAGPPGRRLAEAAARNGVDPATAPRL